MPAPWWAKMDAERLPCRRHVEHARPKGVGSASVAPPQIRKTIDGPDRRGVGGGPEPNDIGRAPVRRRRICEYQRGVVPCARSVAVSQVRWRRKIDPNV